MHRSMVLTPLLAATPAVAIAATRCGGIGVLDAEFEIDHDRTLAHLAELERLTSGEFGLKLGPAGGPLLDRLASVWPERLKWVILSGGLDAGSADRASTILGHGVHLLFEAVCVEEAELAGQLGASGIVAKGEEAGGRIGTTTAFVLLQSCLRRTRLPIWVQGGVGLHTGAACQAAGAAGVVLDSQMLLSREAMATAADRKRLAAFDGTQAVILGERLGVRYRAYRDPLSPLLEQLQGVEAELAASSIPAEQKRNLWRESVSRAVHGSSGQRLWLLGQDAVLADRLGKRFGTVAGIVQAIERHALEGVQAAARANPLAEGSLLAQRQGTRHAIVQGPMTRVSDTAAFAEVVAREGALPLLALGMMRRDEIEPLLAETKSRLAGRPWGAGILGFLAPEIRREQAEAVLAAKPPAVLIAGGRPDQAAEFEQHGIAVYLHVPSAELLEHYLRAGARRFVFEGSECGGHIGPRTSFVLWETVCQRLLSHVETTAPAADLSVLFAGGIHDGLSAAMVAAIAAPLAARGVAVGVLMGTAYLFTREAVECGAVVGRYQDEMIRARRTVVLESGRGHVTRCLDTPYVQQYEEVRRRLLASDKGPDEVRDLLEQMNVGRLRIASKGLCRTAEVAQGSVEHVFDARKLRAVADNEQFNQGMYMAGEVAALRDEVTTVADLHDEIGRGSSQQLQQHVGPVSGPLERQRGADVAIIGMSCFFPKAGSLRAYWQNILDRRDAISEVPLDHWDWRLYYDPDPQAAGKMTSKWGGFLDDIPFDPLRYGMPPNALSSIEPLQMMLLEAARLALDDAGYAERPFNRERTAVILGAGGGAAQLSMAYAMEAYLPLLKTVPGLEKLADEILAKCEPLLPAWSEDTFPGILLNVAAGRVANRFNLNGPNFSVDAACGSSLAALYAGVRELQTLTSDVALVMGGDTVQNPFTYLLFSKTGAFSPNGRSRPFDESADGIAISEGVGVVVLKRLADAQRDGDRVYAVIKGMGSSSDGKDKGLTAPRPEGQVRALTRAYQDAGISPARIGLLESHGTGTVVGDRTEVESASRVFLEGGAPRQSCSLGSVKSLIGHTKCAAGLAGLINACLALYHKVRPPMLLSKPNAKARFEETPFFLNTEPRPWVHGGPEPRCAAVSAFGFGGTNFHAVLEEYTADCLEETGSALPQWPAELFVFRGRDREAVALAADSCRSSLARAAGTDMGSLAASLWDAAGEDAAKPTLTIVAASPQDLSQKLDVALNRLRAGDATLSDPRGIYWAEAPAARRGKVAFLFPGQGSQYPNMLAQLAIAFPEVRRAFDEAERLLLGALERPLGSTVFPPSTFSPEETERAKRALMRSDIAQPAIGAASLGIFHLLDRLGVRPDFLAGHSYGDFAALSAAGAIGEDDLIRISYQRGRSILAASGEAKGGMVAVEAGAEILREIIATVDGVVVANYNGPNQVVASGSESGLDKLVEALAARGIAARRIDVNCAFHSPWVSRASQSLATALAKVRFGTPSRTVYSNTTAAPFPADPEALKQILVEHLTSPVRFQQEIEGLYEAGARLFVEVGPGGVLTGLVKQILGERPHLALLTNHRSQADLLQFQQVLAQLLVHGIDVQLARLYSCRGLSPIPLDELAAHAGDDKYSPSTWLVNSVRARPWQAPEPPVFGRAAAASTPASRPLGHGAGGDQAAAGPVAVYVHGNGHQSPRPGAPNGQPSRLSATDQAMSQPVLNPPPLPADAAEAARVVLGFQDLMSKFLETQRAVMASYLAAAGTAGPAAGASVPVMDTQRAANVQAPTQRAAPPASGERVAEPDSPVAATGSTSTAPDAARPAPANGSARGAAMFTRETLAKHLVTAVSKRTGYPEEMLELNLNLEADLGVDSIKRVEILSGLIGSSGWDAGVAIEMEKLTSLKSLAAIIDYLLDALKSSSGSDLQHRPSTNGNGTTARTIEPAVATALAVSPRSAPTQPARREEAREIRRMQMQTVPIALPRPGRSISQCGPLLITADSRGVACQTVRRLRQLGVQAVLVAMPHANGRSGEYDLAADLTNPHEVERLLASLDARWGVPAGLVHLAPLSPASRDDDWRDRVQREVYSLFLLASGLSRARQQKAAPRPTTLLAATAMGGSFGYGDHALSESFFAGQGGVAGIVKSVAHEWPDALVRVVDFDAAESVEWLADRIVAELSDTTAPVEVGYQLGERISLECCDAPLTSLPHSTPALDPGAPVLITGGACGITAEVALEVGRQFRSRLMLLGRSALPAEHECSATAGLSDAAELKAAILVQLRREGRKAIPATVEAAYRRLLRDREIRSNLARFRDAGIDAHYFQADVRDPVALERALREIETRFGSCQGLFHAAGVIDDKLIGDKSSESFDHVFGTKVEGALHLTRLLDPEQLKLCVFFASVAGRFGNGGQTDYAAANEVLSKLAMQLDRQWPHRVLSVVWGPWSQIGMVSQLEGHLTGRGVDLIAPAIGRRLLAEEIAGGRKGEREVIIAGGMGNLARRCYGTASCQRKAEAMAQDQAVR